MPATTDGILDYYYYYYYYYYYSSLGAKELAGVNGIVITVNKLDDIGMAFHFLHGHGFNLEMCQLSPT